MINISGTDYYEAYEMTDILEMQYSSVIFLLRKNHIPKYKNKYIISKEQAENLKERKKQNTKFLSFEEYI